MAKQAYVDQEACIGCELCVNTCPGVFRMTAEQKAEAFDPAGGSEEEVQAAIDGCPVSCIHWQDK